MSSQTPTLFDSLFGEENDPQKDSKAVSDKKKKSKSKSKSKDQQDLFGLFEEPSVADTENEVSQSETEISDENEILEKPDADKNLLENSNENTLLDQKEDQLIEQSYPEQIKTGNESNTIIEESKEFDSNEIIQNNIPDYFDFPKETEQENTSTDNFDQEIVYELDEYPMDILNNTDGVDIIINDDFENDVIVNAPNFIEEENTVANQLNNVVEDSELNSSQLRTNPDIIDGEIIDLNSFELEQIEELDTNKEEVIDLTFDVVNTNKQEDTTIDSIEISNDSLIKVTAEEEKEIEEEEEEEEEEINTNVLNDENQLIAETNNLSNLDSIDAENAEEVRPLDGIQAFSNITNSTLEKQQNNDSSFFDPGYDHPLEPSNTFKSLLESSLDNNAPAEDTEEELILEIKSEANTQPATSIINEEYEEELIISKDNENVEQDFDTSPEEYGSEIVSVEESNSNNKEENEQESGGLDEKIVLPEWNLDKNYYTIGAVAKMFDVNISHIRFWTNEFNLKPRTNKKGDRLYSPENIKTLQLIHHLVKVQKHTIKGAKEKLKTKKKAVEAGRNLKEYLTQLKETLVNLRMQLD